SSLPRATVIPSTTKFSRSPDGPPEATTIQCACQSRGGSRKHPPILHLHIGLPPLSRGGREAKRSARSPSGHLFTFLSKNPWSDPSTSPETPRRHLDRRPLIGL